MSKKFNKLFLMDNSIKNLTLEEYKKIRLISITIFLVIIQAAYLYQPLFQYIFGSKDIAHFITGLFINATLFTGIYYVVAIIHERVWIHRNYNTCYISGTWYHVFERVVDNNKGYVRAGWLTISQNYYNLSVDAFNYNVTLVGDKLEYDEKKCSHWSFALSELDVSGKIKACFTKDTEYVDLVSRSGIMELFVERSISKERINRIYGVFSDSGVSTVKGNIKLFRYKLNQERDPNFIKYAPREWSEYIKEQLTIPSADTTADTTTPKEASE